MATAKARRGAARSEAGLAGAQGIEVGAARSDDALRTSALPSRPPFPGARDLLARAHEELRLAEVAPDAAEAFRHAHMSALRAAAWMVAVRRPGPTRGRPRSAWELLEREAPELREWAAYFACGAGVRAALESGADEAVSPERAGEELVAARLFLDLVEGLPAARAS